MMGGVPETPQQSPTCTQTQRKHPRHSRRQLLFQRRWHSSCPNWITSDPSPLSSTTYADKASYFGIALNTTHLTSRWTFGARATSYTPHKSAHYSLVWSLNSSIKSATRADAKDLTIIKGEYSTAFVTYEAVKQQLVTVADGTLYKSSANRFTV